jgi:beta-lactamase regulating signal transducer with metallopeptidase domain/protocatechuate 3,4-dioxygenase beta subunit
MSGLISWLNSLGDGFVLFTIRMLIQSSVLILILLLLDLVLRRRVRAVVRYGIWLLVLAKLVLPPSLSSPTSLVSWIRGRLPETTIVSFVPDLPPTVHEAVPPAAPAPTGTPPSPVGANDYSPLQPAGQIPVASVQPVVLPTWQALVLVAWAAAVVIMVVLLIQRVFFVRALLAQSQEAPAALGTLLEQCRRSMGVRRVAGVRLTGLSASPSVCGLLRPVILMPEPMARQLETPHLRSVLLHELAHIKRGDLWINLLQTLLQIVYLYHPLLWLANARIRAIREQAVDEAVLAALGADAEEYPRTLLSISKLAFGTPSLSLRLLGVVESKRALTARIRFMVSRPFPKNARLGLLGLAAVAVIAVALLPMARGREGRTPTPAPGKPADVPAAVSVDGVTVELLGLREYPGTGELWWRADGTPVAGAGFAKFRTTDPAYSDPKARVRVLVVRLASPSPLRDVALSWSLTNARESSFLPLYQDDQKKVLDPVQTFVARFNDDAATTDLKVGVAAGVWRSAAAGSEGNTTAYARDNLTQSDVIYHPVEEQDGSLHITATHLLGRDYDCRIVAEDESHKVFGPTRYNNSGYKMRLCTSVLNVPLAQVKWFRLQARPFQWVDFKDVRLIPESSARNGGESASAPAPATEAPAGVVLDEQGKPVPGARVLLYFRNNSWGLGNKVVEETRTDAQGRFTLTQPFTYKIDAGTTYTDHFLLFATHPDFSLAWRVLTSGAPQKECRLTMTPPVTQAFHVTDREGKPLAGARVWIRGAGRNDERNPLMRPSFAVPEDISLLTATTDDQGQATVTNLPRTDCSFSASLPGYSDRFRFASTPSPGEARIEMTRAGTATGQVLTKDGKPVAGAQVWFQADWGEWYFDYAVTDETGRFRNDKIVARGGSWVSGGGTGQYKVTLRHPNFAAPEVTVQFEPGKTEEFNIEATPGTLLHIQVLEPETERPLAGARVAGSSLGGRLDGYTDANGVFERCVLNGQASVFFNSPPGRSYVLEHDNRSPAGARDSARVLADGGIEKVTLYAPSRLHPLVSIKGRLQLPDGRPAGGIKISTTNNMPRYHTATWVGRGSAYTRTNPDGSFELADVPRDAEVFLYGETSDYRYILAEILDPAQASPELARPLVMREGHTASVVLTDASGKPRVNMALKLRPRKWEDYVFRADDRPAATDAEGRLTLNGIVPGLEYFIRDAQANMGESGWWNLYNENRVLLAAADVLRVEGVPPSNRGQDARDMAAGVIAGVVVDARGTPIAGASIIVENKDLLLLPQPEKIGGQIRRVIRADSTQTDSEGRFRFTDLNPGKTGITVAATGYRTEFALSTATGTEDLRVALGEPRPYRHSGVVADISCRPVAGVEVTFIEETLSGPGKGKDGPPVTVRTDERGQYRFDRLLSPVDRQSVRRFLYARKAGYGVWGCEPDTTGGQATGIIRLMAEEKVSGVVKDEAGVPIAGATVWLSAGWGYFGSIRFAPTWQHLAPHTTTRADGSFTLGQLPTDSDLSLQVHAEGFAADGVWPVRTGKFGGYAIRRGDTTTVMGAGGEPNTPLTIALQRAIAASKSDKLVLPPGATAGKKTEWPVSAGGNGHFYQGVRMPKPLPWNEADRLAKLLGGHLVTITSAAENDFVFRLIDDDTYWYHSYNWRGPWIGALQPPGSAEPDGGWTWVTGEPFTYTRWDAGQPNNFNGSPENRAHFGNQRSRIPTWNDVRENFEEVVSFVVEWDKTTWPVSDLGVENEKYQRMSPQEVAQRFFQACAERNWDEACKFHSVSQGIKDWLGGLKIISIGTPVHRNTYDGWLVPYRIKLKSGEVRKRNLAVRPGPYGRFVVDGGL